MIVDMFMTIPTNERSSARYRDRTVDRRKTEGKGKSSGNHGFDIPSNHDGGMIVKIFVRILVLAKREGRKKYKVM